MKKKLSIFNAAIFRFAKEKIVPSSQNDGTFNASMLDFFFTVNNLKGVNAPKSVWEKGDKIFIFFKGVTTGHITIEYARHSWKPTVYGAIELAPAGKLTAVYFPYDNTLSASWNGSVWTFSQIQDAYYMVAENIDYNISSTSEVATLSSALNMEVPSGFVYLFIGEGVAKNEAYTLQTDAIAPIGVASISVDGTVSETENKTGGLPIVGYAYKKGYLFSGKLVSPYNDGYGNDLQDRYYFIKTKVSDGSREDYFTVDRTLATLGTVTLPAMGDAKWIAVGADKWVDLGHPEVLFATCNYNCIVPESVGKYYTFDNAKLLEGVGFPTKEHFEWLVDDSLNTWTWMKVNGKTGMVVKSKTTSGFLFLPAGSSIFGVYGSSIAFDVDHAWGAAVDFNGSHYVDYFDHDFTYAERPVRYKQGNQIINSIAT